MSARLTAAPKIACQQDRAKNGDARHHINDCTDQQGNPNAEN